MKNLKAFVLFLGMLLAPFAQAEIELGQIRLPVGFSIDVYAENVVTARQMTLGDQGPLLVSNRKASRVRAVTDADGAVLSKEVFASGWLP